jgi:hypothetical protein
VTSKGQPVTKPSLLPGFDVSADGRWLVSIVARQGKETLELWSRSLETGTETMLGEAPGYFAPRLSRDGSLVAYRSFRLIPAPEQRRIRARQSDGQNQSASIVCVIARRVVGDAVSATSESNGAVRIHDPSVQLRAGRDGGYHPSRVRGSLACDPKFAEGERRVVTLFFTSWNRIGQWLRHVDGLRQRPEPSAVARACAIGKRCDVTGHRKTPSRLSLLK